MVRSSNGNLKKGGMGFSDMTLGVDWWICSEDEFTFMSVLAKRQYENWTLMDNKGLSTYLENLTRWFQTQQTSTTSLVKPRDIHSDG